MIRVNVSLGAEMYYDRTDKISYCFTSASKLSFLKNTIVSFRPPIDQIMRLIIKDIGHSQPMVFMERLDE